MLYLRGDALSLSLSLAALLLALFTSIISISIIIIFVTLRYYTSLRLSLLLRRGECSEPTSSSVHIMASKYNVDWREPQHGASHGASHVSRHGARAVLAPMLALSWSKHTYALSHIDISL